MTKRLDSMIGEKDYNGLLASTAPAALVATAEVTQGDAAIPAGTVVVKGETGKYAPVAAALTSASIVLVLSEDVPAGKATEVVAAYKTGNFARGRLSAAASYTLTSNDYDYMRQAGILSEDVID